MPTTLVRHAPEGAREMSRLRFYWKLLVPKIPVMIRVAIFHVLRMTEPSKYLDLKSNLVISFLRDMMDSDMPQSVATTQAFTLRDAGVKGKIWVSTVASKVPPEESVRTTILDIIESMKVPGVQYEDLGVPDIVPVTAEWTGHREQAHAESRPPQISEEAKYHEMMKECRSPTTVLYFHGGAYYLLGPHTHRKLTRRLAKDTGGRVYSVRYRLAPQHVFPSQLLDALCSYLTLLYPPPGAIHDAVSATHIVFSGDSAGGNLSLALLQCILQMQRQGRTIAWFGKERDVPLPAGVAVNSPWLDITQSMPSIRRNHKWDYLPPAGLVNRHRTPPPDEIWPASPARKHLFALDDYLMHPLVSLHHASSWKGSCPVWLVCGWECLADEDKYLAKKLDQDGVTVLFEEYEAMPHCFAMILPGLVESRRCLQSWTSFLSTACTDPGASRLAQPNFTLVKARTCGEVPLQGDTLSSFTPADVVKMATDLLARAAPAPARL